MASYVNGTLRIISNSNVSDMVELAKADEGMKDLLDKAMVYYLLKRPVDDTARRTVREWADFWKSGF